MSFTRDDNDDDLASTRKKRRKNCDPEMDEDREETSSSSLHVCPVCKRAKYIYRQGLMRHMRAVHPGEDIPNLIPKRGKRPTKVYNLFVHSQVSFGTSYHPWSLTSISSILFMHITDILT